MTEKKGAATGNLNSPFLLTVFLQTPFLHFALEKKKCGLLLLLLLLVWGCGATAVWVGVRFLGDQRDSIPTPPPPPPPAAAKDK